MSTATKRPRSDSASYLSVPPKKSRLALQVLNNNLKPHKPPRAKRSFVKSAIGAMGRLLGLGASAHELVPHMDDGSSEPERSSSPDPLDSISLSSDDSPHQEPRSNPSQSSSQFFASTSKSKARQPVRPNRDAYSQRKTYTLTSDVGLQQHRTGQNFQRPFAYQMHPQDRTTQDKIISRFAGQRKLDRQKSITRLKDRVEGIRGVLGNHQSSSRFGEVLYKPKNGYDPNAKGEIGTRAKERASHSSTFDISAILERLNIQREKVPIQPPKPSIPTSLSPEQEKLIAKHLSNPSFKRNLQAAEVNHSSLKRLRPGAWLDDEIINGYCDLMCKRFAGKEGNGRKVHFLNSFFYGKLASQGYESARLKRWTKKVDIFALDALVFPINQGNQHWTCAAINFALKRIEYYDSLGDYSSSRKEVFSNIREYLEKESKDKKGKSFDFTGWVDEYNKKSPQQDNGSDCGVFSLQTLETITRGRDLAGKGFEFTAKNMPFFRKLMVYEIAEGKLEKRTWGEPAL